MSGAVNIFSSESVLYKLIIIILAIFRQIAESQDQPSESVASGQESPNTENEGVINPLQYRPTQYRQRQKDAPEPVRLL